METFLVLCDDAESDVRIVADECLNRTIKVTIAFPNMSNEVMLLCMYVCACI